MNFFQRIAFFSKIEFYGFYNSKKFEERQDLDILSQNDPKHPRSFWTIDQVHLQIQLKHKSTNHLQKVHNILKQHILPQKNYQNVFS